MDLIIMLMDTSELWSDASHFLVSAPDLSFKLNQVLFYLNIIISNNINITTNNWYIIRYKCFSFSRIISPPFLYFEREAPEVQMYLYYYNTRKCLLQIARFFILKAKKKFVKMYISKKFDYNFNGYIWTLIRCFWIFMGCTRFKLQT